MLSKGERFGCHEVGPNPQNASSEGIVRVSKGKICTDRASKKRKGEAEMETHEKRQCDAQLGFDESISLAFLCPSSSNFLLLRHARFF
jgi:hypothetical protein